MAQFFTITYVLAQKQNPCKTKLCKCMDIKEVQVALGCKAITHMSMLRV